MSDEAHREALIREIERKERRRRVVRVTVVVVILVVIAGLITGNRVSNDAEVIAREFEGLETSYKTGGDAERVAEYVSSRPNLTGGYRVTYRIGEEKYHADVTVEDRENFLGTSWGTVIGLETEVFVDAPVPVTSVCFLNHCPPGDYPVRSTVDGVSVHPSTVRVVPGDEPFTVIPVTATVDDAGRQRAADAVAHHLWRCPGIGRACPEWPEAGWQVSGVSDVTFDVTDDSPDHFGGIASGKARVTFRRGGEWVTEERDFSVEVYVDLIDDRPEVVP